MPTIWGHCPSTHTLLHLSLILLGMLFPFFINDKTPIQLDTPLCCAYKNIPLSSLQLISPKHELQAAILSLYFGPALPDTL